MTVMVHLDAQRGGYRQEITHWRYRQAGPASERGFTGLDDSKKYLFTCKQCGCTEFADLSESMAECNNCSTQYVFRYCG